MRKTTLASIDDRKILADDLNRTITTNKRDSYGKLTVSRQSRQRLLANQTERPSKEEMKTKHQSRQKAQTKNRFSRQKKMIKNKSLLRDDRNPGTHSRKNSRADPRTRPGCSVSPSSGPGNPLYFDCSRLLPQN